MQKQHNIYTLYLYINIFIHYIYTTIWFEVFFIVEVYLFFCSGITE